MSKGKLLAECNGVRWYLVTVDGFKEHLIESGEQVDRTALMNISWAAESFAEYVLETIDKELLK